MSIVGPLVNPNKLETRFDRTAFAYRTVRHPFVWTSLALAALTGAGIYAHIIPVDVHF